MKDEACLINLDDKNSNGIHWISLFIDRNIGVYFNSFRMEYIPEEVLKKSKINQLVTISLEFKIMNNVWILLYGFYRIYTCRKNFFRLS